MVLVKHMASYCNSQRLDNSQPCSKDTWLLGELLPTIFGRPLAYVSTIKWPLCMLGPPTIRSIDLRLANGVPSAILRLAFDLATSHQQKGESLTRSANTLGYCVCRLCKIMPDGLKTVGYSYDSRT